MFANIKFHLFFVVVVVVGLLAPYGEIFLYFFTVSLATMSIFCQSSIQYVGFSQCPFFLPPG